jgi:hypothetical protein
MGFLQFIGSFVSTLLPERYRRGTPAPVYAIASGIVQGFVCVFLLIFRFLWFSESGGELLDREHAFDLFVRFGGEYVQANMVAGLARFWLSPVNFFLVYLVFEGVLRSMAAMTSGQIVPALPFYAVAGIHGLIEKAAYKRKLGDMIPDQVFRGNEKQGFALKIYSSRPKSHWNSYITIEFEGVHYQLMREEPAPAPHLFVYYLRLSPGGRPASVIDHYTRDSVLRPLQDKWVGTPRTLDRLRRLLDRGPLIPDELVRGKGWGAEFDLKICSCRAKQDWNADVTIEYENRWYELYKEERGSKPRPYVYYLRKCSMKRASIVLRHYAPDDVMKTKN